jgi:acetyltransferase-like isoleucine patch superfamily enzyme
MRQVVIIGAGVHGREILEILRHQAQTQSDLQALGLIDDDTKLKGQTIDGAPVLGTWDWFEGVDRREVKVICASGFSEIRKRMADRAVGIGLRFANAISPVSYVSANAVIGEGVVIYQNGKLGAYATLNPGVNLAGDISIGEGCYLGIGCSVIQGINIGAWTTIGAGAAVVSHVPANVTAVGVPDRVIKTREKGWHEEFTSAAGK